MTNEQDLPVLQWQGPNKAPRAMVLAGPATRPLTLASAKRQRFVNNLHANFQRLKEALEFVEHFAVVCEVSEAKIRTLRAAKDAMLSELSDTFGQKLEAYNKRTGGSSS